MELSVADMIGLLVRACILSTVFALGLNATWEEITYLLHRPGLLVRSLLATYVLTPLIAVLLVLALPAPVAVEIAVLLMAISAGAPVLPKKLLQLAANPSYVYSLAVIMALLAIVTVPLALLSAFFQREASVPPGQVASVITTVFLAPLLTGMVVRYLWPRLAERIGEPLISTAGIILLVLIPLIVASNFSAVVGMGLPAFILIVLMTVAALAVGHVLGGPDSHDRIALAIACATRFPALALLVASLNFPNRKPLPIVVAYLLASNLTVLLYMRWRKTPRGAQNVGQASVAAARR